MSNKKNSTPSPIQQLITFAAPKENKSIISLPISDTENYDIEVKQLLNADEMASFVDGVSKAVFSKGKYIPILFDLVYANAVIAYYTNLEIATIDKKTKEPISLISNDELVSLVYNTDIIREIESKINFAQKEDIILAIVKSIDYRKQEILNTQSARLEGAIQQIENSTEIISKIVEQFNDVDVKQVMDATIKLANIPERNLVNNILDVKFGETKSNEVDEQLKFNDSGDKNV